MNLDSSEKQQFGDCVISKLKVVAPNGLGNLTVDRVKVLLRNAILDCKKEFKKATYKVWTQSLKDGLMQKMMNSPQLAKFDYAVRNRVCNCYIKEMESRYPNGFKKEIPDSVQQAIIVKCSK